MSHVSTPPLAADRDDVAAVAQWAQTYALLKQELGQVIVGQQEVIEQMLIAVLARGHCLLEGVPGLAKTLMVSSLAKVMSLSFHRVQFTPDLMPSDITGTDVLQEDPLTHERKYVFVRGPLFANLILADEINRTPPKTQAAMLEAMQERAISAGGTTHALPDPFFVLATQNPLEQEGTYPLPEAQLDRFLMYVKVGYPSGAEEWEIARRITSSVAPRLQPVVSHAQITQAQDLVRRLPVCDQVVGFAWALVRASRPHQPEAPPFVNKWVNWGAGPRGVLGLISAAKARAFLHGRHHATTADVQAVVAPVLRHRLAPNYAALAAGVNSEKIIQGLLESVPADKVYAAPVTAS